MTGNPASWLTGELRKLGIDGLQGDREILNAARTQASKMLRCGEVDQALGWIEAIREATDDGMSRNSFGVPDLWVGVNARALLEILTSSDEVSGNENWLLIAEKARGNACLLAPFDQTRGMQFHWIEVADLGHRQLDALGAGSYDELSFLFRCALLRNGGREDFSWHDPRELSRLFFELQAESLNWLDQTALSIGTQSLLSKLIEAEDRTTLRRLRSLKTALTRIAQLPSDVLLGGALKDVRAHIHLIDRLP